ncbi:energy-coupled thiamine transporter ThiT [Thalassobacillus sp. CUG 92003]|uniref:energy-coupled thiamine transporter ThiT n=1 Tax=Thalassobacillus sp. CUG 92003 TaxID=2736641 RepID=UPI0015E6699B|nr:energy-coupled thiamine transporter ThiT [Thalassobacillus sp. CUG 92003]
MRNNRVLFLVEIAIFSAMALLLDIIPFLSFKLWAQGGSISFAMIPIFLVALRWGVKGGVLAGLLFGFYQILTGAYILVPIQAVLDYIVAFGVLGLAGIFARTAKNALQKKHMTSFVTYVSLGVFLGSLLRFIAHFYAGIAFFSEMAGDQTVWVYSLVYNGSYMLPGFVLSAIVLCMLFYKQPRLLLGTGSSNMEDQKLKHHAN